MNNPVRSALQRFYEAPLLRELGGVLDGGTALEIGCGRGVGTRLILEVFGADHVDAFDLDPAMIEVAQRRLAGEARVHLWVGDAERIEADDDVYDAVFDFGIIHHIPRWRAALAEVHRVLKPGGRFFAEEVLKDLILQPAVRRVVEHPLDDRFTHEEFLEALEAAGFRLVAERSFRNAVGWYVADC